jgi:hypothetical protein
MMRFPGRNPKTWTTQPTDLPKLGGHYRGDFVVAMADGSVLIVRKNVSEKMLRAAITASGGEVMDENWNEPTK